VVGSLSTQPTELIGDANGAVYRANVVDVYKTVEADGEPYFVMTCLGGRSLANRLNEFSTSAGRAVGVLSAWQSAFSTPTRRAWATAT
jgi:hypothetical protein